MTTANRPGAGFAFKPHNTLSSSQEPDFSRSPRKTKDTVARALNDRASPLLLPEPRRHLHALSANMVNERAPPVASSSKDPLQSTTASNGNLPRQKSPDSDDEYDTLFSRLSAVKGVVRDVIAETGLKSSSSSQNSPFGHPSKMLSSRKQKASNVFIQQKSRPEHHVGTQVRGPAPPTAKARKPAPLALFDSMTGTAPPTGSSSSRSKSYSDEVFYTDPNKASADLKDLLEGNMEEEEEEDGENAESVTKENSSVSQNSKSPRGSKDSKESKDPKDGTLEGLKVKLLPHQVEGVQWMRGRELGPVKRGKVPKGGILADDMGLGKTLQTLSLILTNQKPGKDDPAWKKQFEGIEKTTLVVAPLALIRQWESEIIEKIAKTHQLKVCVHHGPNRTKRAKDLALYDIVVTTYQILVSEHAHTSLTADGVKAGCFGLHWWRVVLDEAHTIKNRNAKATKACCDLRSEYRWCLSGTPMQNNLDELQSLIKFLRIRPYDDLREWKEHIDKPMRNGKGHIALRRLHSLLQCFMKRRTKEILKVDGALNPGGKPTEEGKPSTTGFKVTERKIVTVSTELSPAERKFYTRLEARADKSIEAMLGGKVNYASALTLLLRMRQACNHPKLVEGKLEKDKDALSTDASQKTQDADIDSMADMLAGMGIESKNCSICGYELTRDDIKQGIETCKDCASDLAYFNNRETRDRKKPKKKSKIKKVEKKVVAVPKKSSRRPRNRNAIIDSDDEEEEGSWLVPENERGVTRLGKAGGEEDENAEGGGDWIGSHDSDDDEVEDQSRSSLSFVVDDETARKEKGYVSANDGEESSDDDSLLSVSAITKQLASQTLEDKKQTPSDMASVTASDTSDSETDDDESGVDESSLVYSDDDDFGPSRHIGGGPPVLASAKIRELVKLLRKEVNDHKFIVFSQFTSMLDLVEPFLDKEGFKFTRYDGSMRNDEREESLRRLRTDKSTRILLCSLKCGSLGLNLTAATRVVIIEPFWNPVRTLVTHIHRLVSRQRLT
jgi:SNF2 family DNA or RNA helicase